MSSPKHPGRKRHFWSTLIWGIVVVIVSAMLAIWISGYTYLYKTLIYTYPNIDDLNIFPTRMVEDKSPKLWPISTECNKGKLPANTLTELESNESVAYLIIRNDSIVHEEYRDNYNKGSLSNSFSVAKSIVGILVGIAVDEGKFKLDDPVGKYLKAYSDTPNSKLTIRNLLMMSSGLNWDESYNSLFSITTEAYYGSDLKNLVEHLKVVEEPGKTFRYMSCNTLLLSIVISKTTGMSLTDYASEKLWIPLHAEQPAYWSLDHADGQEKAYCCFYSTARDFAKIGKLYMDSGAYNGKQIVSKEFVRESLTPINIKDDSGNSVDYYGYHWWLMKYKNHEMFYARGILGQYIVVIPDEHIIMVRLGKKRGIKSGNHYADMIAYVDGALEAYGKK